MSDAVFAPMLADQVRNLRPGKGSTPLDIVATFDGMAAHLWNLADNSHMADFRPLYAVQSIAIATDTESPLLLTGDRAIRIFDASEDSPRFGQTISKISDPHRGVVTSLKFSPDKASRRFVSCGADGSAELWQWNADLNAAVSIRSLQTTSPTQTRPGISEASWSPNGQLVVLTNRDGSFSIIDVEKPEVPVLNLKIDTDETISLNAGSFYSDGQFIAVGGQMVESGASCGWIYDVSDMKQPRLHATINGHEAGGIRSLAFMPDSSYVVTGGADGAAILWNWQPQRRDATGLAAYEAYQFLFEGESVAHQAPITSLAVSDSGTIASVSEDGTAIIWRNPFK